MFKNLTIARVSGIPMLAAAEGHAQANAFAPCGPTQPKSIGFVPPREENGAMIEPQSGHWIMAVQIEQRTVPGATLKKRVEEMAAAIEDQTGRKPGKKQRRELKDQAQLELLPQAFTKTKRVLVWLDTQRGILAVDTASAGVFDDVTMMLGRAFDGLQMRLVMTTLLPATCMAGWLLSDALPPDDEERPAAAIEPPAEFTIDRECELKAPDESKAVVRYSRHPLDTDEVRSHIEQGKRPTRLAMTWKGRVSFVLTDQMVLKKIEFLDVVADDAKRHGEDDAFDADVAIFTGELRPLLVELIDALGGEMQLQAEGGAA